MEYDMTTSPLKKPMDSHPRVFVIMCRHPNRNRITDDGIIAYGFPGQPYPDRLLHRGPGMAFRTREDARQHLVRSLKKDADSEYVKKCKFEIIPVYLPWSVKRVRPNASDHRADAQEKHHDH
jgi:hypothetical protein